MAAEKNQGAGGFAAACRGLRITPHVAQNHKRSGGSAIDGRTTRRADYEASQKVRKRILDGVATFDRHLTCSQISLLVDF